MAATKLSNEFCVRRSNDPRLLYSSHIRGVAAIEFAPPGLFLLLFGIIERGCCYGRNSGCSTGLKWRRAAPVSTRLSVGAKPPSKTIRPDASARRRLTRPAKTPGSKWTRYLTYHDIPGTHQTTGRRSPASWREQKIFGDYIVRDANGQARVPIYARSTKSKVIQAKVLTMEEARRIAMNIAKLPALLKP